MQEKIKAQTSKVWSAFYNAQSEQNARGSGLGPPGHVVLREKTYNDFVKSVKELLSLLSENINTL